MRKLALIVDDSDLVREILATLLEELTWASDSTESPRHALLMMEEQRYDLILTDYQMPGMNGIELARKVREVSPHSSVILMTATPQGDLMVLSGADGFLLKPFSLDALRQSLAAVFDGTEEDASRTSSPPA